MYLLEELGDERFQQLAQALLLSAFPTAQILPVGMPDGGRDAFIRPSTRNPKEHVVFQVKYSKSPTDKSERDVIEQLVRSDVSRIKELVAAGATQYYLITNVRGTSHPASGSIDRVNNELTAHTGIDSYCWWRDDIDARLANSSDVRWAFPEILKGNDVLEHLTEGLFRDQTEERNRAIRSYIAVQYDTDSEVRFKQVELQNKLLLLFVDLPISHSQLAYRNKDLFFRPYEAGAYYYEDADSMPSAAQLLLDASNTSVSRVVLEGAPGQGKSTVTQYLCQVHRMRLLGRTRDMSAVDEKHITSRLRIPFRIDLRDYAAWLSGRNPFLGESSTPPTSPSLESFVAHQVSHLSGGMPFTPSDFLSIVKNGPICIVLDGFDEVADIPQRRMIIEELTRSSSRIRAHQPDAQIIVTSRPAAFANSPGFSHKDWTHLELQDLRTPQINAYADKWMQARNLPQRDRQQLTLLLREKLGQPHMRDLARNPMQLTILLALINARGLSLPDKRTALYDSYMEHFFNRESEKSRVVLEHRDLLIDIHRYIAWTLHCRAEREGTGGAISQGDLKSLLSIYLATEGHDPTLVESIFTGMIERVVALVSRVQGTYEFEVQPLREYFAARHLYETAPYSPTGHEIQGTKTERLDALLRNFYWLNVLRFYCGCYSKGELASILVGLREADNSPILCRTAHPRVVAAILLGDWVFSQQPVTASDVFSFIFSGSHPKLELSSFAIANHNSFQMSDARSRNEMTARCRALLGAAPPDYAAILSRIVRINATAAENYEWWCKSADLFLSVREWAEAGFRMGLLAPENSATARPIPQRLFSNYTISVEMLSKAGRYDIIYGTPALYAQMLEMLGLLFRVAPSPIGTDGRLWSMNNVVIALSPESLWSLATAGSGDMPAVYSMMREVPGVYHDWRLERMHDVDSSIARTWRDISRLLEEPARYWGTALEVWKELLAVVDGLLGPSWLGAAIAMASSGVRARKELGRWDQLGWTLSGDLCSRLRFARLKSGVPKWWRENIPTDSSQITLWLATLFTWGTEKTILELLNEIELTVDILDEDHWQILAKLLERSRPSPLFRRTGGISKVPNLSPRGFYLASFRTQRGVLVKQASAAILSGDRRVARAACEVVLEAAFSGGMSWRDALDIVRQCYSIGVTTHINSRDDIQMPADIAEEICCEPEVYPVALVSVAQRVLAARAGESAPKLSDVSSEGHWFGSAPLALARS